MQPLLLYISIRYYLYMDKEKKISELAAAAIERLKELPQPVVRICGPLTSGGNGYEENLALFKKAEKILIEKGFTVFDYFTNNHDEEDIYEMGMNWETVMELYHKPILAANILDTAFLLPDWQNSNGSCFEHHFITRHTKTKIREFPEEWLKSD